jgi:hypothetical protein
MFQDCEFGRFIESASPNIATVNGKPVIATQTKKFKTPKSVSMSTSLLAFLKVNQSSLHVRLHWGVLCDIKAREFFRKEGIENVTDGIRPLDNEQYSISGTVEFPLPPAFLMKELEAFDSKVERGQVLIHSASLAIALIKAGFLADRSAKF